MKNSRVCFLHHTKYVSKLKLNRYSRSEKWIKMLIITILAQNYFSTNIFSQELETYESAYNHWDINKYLQQYQRAFDSSGIITQKNEYHPLTISFYGILNYHEFQKTGDSLYYQRVLNQYKYFKNTSRLMYLDEDKSIGLPYQFNFNGLKAPWFSGMTQGTAVSFLLRYYDLTNDKSALELSEKMMHLLLKSEHEGGTIGRTKEGYPWIEEYPSCTASKSVLNGFVNGLIGLKEYCAYFPKDTEAKMLHDSCYNSMIWTFQEYDKNNWTSYNRNGKSISNSYLRYQINELDHLYDIYKDDSLLLQMKIWTKFSLGKKDTELKFLKHPDFEYAYRLKKEGNEEMYYYEEPQLFEKGLISVVDSFDLSRKKKFNYSLTNKVYYCEIKFDGEIDPLKIDIYATLNKEGVKINKTWNGRRAILQSDKPFDHITVSSRRKFKKGLFIEELRILNRNSYEVPFYAFVDIPEKLELKKDSTYKATYFGIYTSDATVFYRYAKNLKDLTNTKFCIRQSFNLKDNYFKAPEDGVYEFFISYELANPSSIIGDFKLTPN